MEGVFVIVVAIFHLVALHKKWDWFMEFPQCRVMRERYGESGFAAYVYLMCVIVIGLGVYLFFRDA